MRAGLIRGEVFLFFSAFANVAVSGFVDRSLGNSFKALLSGLYGVYRRFASSRRAELGLQGGKI